VGCIHIYHDFYWGLKDVDASGVRSVYFYYGILMNTDRLI
jgi:hypothetical protein